MWTQPKNWTNEQRAKSDELCRRGVYTQLLSPTQRKFFTLANTKDKLESLFYCGRKSGKSYTAFFIGISHCGNRRDAIVRIVLPSLKSAREIYFTIFGEILNVLPKDCWPILLKSESAFLFPKTNSKICLGGSDPSSISNSRGPRASMLILDEVAAFDEGGYDFALKSVLFPQLTVDRGSTIYLTTPPKTPTHPFMQEYYPRLKASGDIITMNIDENELLSPEDVELIVRRYGNRQDPSFRREYLLELIAEADSRLTPEFSKETHVFNEDLDVVLPSEVDGTRDYYGFISADVGITDNTAILGGILHWPSATLYVIKEIVLTGREQNTLSNFYEHLIEMRRFVGAFSSQIIEVADMFEQLRNSLHKDYGVWLPRPSKGPVEGSVGLLRSVLSKEQIKIHESCKWTITELENSCWKDTQSVNKQIERTLAGHSDALMSLCYMVRKVNFSARPGTSLTANPLHGLPAKSDPSFIFSLDTVEIKKKSNIIKK